jgi:hypothetical protein
MLAIRGSTLLTGWAEPATIHSMTTTHPQTIERTEAPALLESPSPALRVRLALATPTDRAFAARLRAAQLVDIVTERLRSL